MRRTGAESQIALILAWALVIAGGAPTRVHAHDRGLHIEGDDVVLVERDEGGKSRRTLIHRFPRGSEIKAVEALGHDAYVLTRTALYRIPEGMRLQRDRRVVKLLWGIPRGPGELGFRSLAWGPQGDLHCSFGDHDPGDHARHWTFFSQPTGTRTPFSGIGGVVRCRPDGTGLHLVASGLRQPSKLAFDSYWNLLTSDFDKNKHPTWRRVTPQAYFGAPPGGTRPLPAALDRDRPVPPPHARDLTQASPESLWQSLRDPAWPTRYRTHLEALRRGPAFAAQASPRLLHSPANDPALAQLIWLAASSQQGSVHLVALTADRDPTLRVQATRALAEFPEPLRGEPIFTGLLRDGDPSVQHAALLAFFSPQVAWDSAAQFTIERGPARSSDPLLQQTATLLLARKASYPQIESLCGRFDASLRMVGVLAAGYRLTLPDVSRPLHAQLPLHLWRDEQTYRIEYADGVIDLREHGRLGTFTLAEHWKADMHTSEQEKLFGLLRQRLADAEESVRKQAARFLVLLNDPRSAADVERVLKPGHQAPK